MSKDARILAFAGSARVDSNNKSLVKVAIKGAEEAGATVTYLDFKDILMPLYDGDLEDEKGLPDTVGQLLDVPMEHSGLLIAAPEYNGSIPPLLHLIPPDRIAPQNWGRGDSHRN